MKILQVNCHSDTSDGGGQSLVAQELSRHLSLRGHECTLLSPGKLNEVSFNETGLTKYSVLGFGTSSLVLPVLDKKTLNNLFNYLDRFRPEIIHIHSLALLETIILFWAVQHQVPVILTLHYLPSQVSKFFPNDKQGKIPMYVQKTGALAVWQSIFFHYCTSIISLNNSTDIELKKFKYKGQIFTIPNGRDMAPLLKINHKIASPKKKVKLIFSGTLCVRKNQMFLLEMLNLLPEEFTLTLVGSNEYDSQYLKKIKDFINDNNLNERVTFTGKIPLPKVIELLEEHHFFVSASKAEVQSLSILEALGAALPIISLSNETTIELINKDNGVLLERTASPNDFASSVQNLTKDYEKQKAMSKVAREKGRKFDWQEVVTKIEGAYQETIIRYNSKPKPKINKNLAKFMEFLDLEYIPKSIDPKKEHAKDKSTPMIWVLAGVAIISSAVMLLNWKMVNLSKQAQSKKLKSD